MISSYVQEMTRYTQSEPVTLIGHSVGGYFALQLLERYPEKIDKVILLFPFLGKTTWKWSMIFKVFTRINNRFLLSNFIIKHKNIFEKVFPKLKDFSNDELKVFFRFGTRQMQYFEKHNLKIETYSKYSSKIDCLYVDKDKWCPLSVINDLEKIS